jgi:lysophospholipase L1-like esterase
VLGAGLALVAGCERETTPPEPARVSSPPETRPAAVIQRGEKRFLALGDSYTIGEGVPMEQTWPSVLAGRLREKGLSVDDPLVIAKTGWTTQDLMRQLDAIRFDGEFDLVTVMVGVNDQYRGGSAEQYRRSLREMLGRAKALAGGDARRVVVLSIPDWTVTPAGQNAARPGASSEIDAFNRVAQEEATSAGMRWADVTAISRREASATVADGLHPSGEQYQKWAEATADVAAEVLRGAGR